MNTEGSESLFTNGRTTQGTRSSSVSTSRAIPPHPNSRNATFPPTLSDHTTSPNTATRPSSSRSTHTRTPKPKPSNTSRSTSRPTTTSRLTTTSRPTTTSGSGPTSTSRPSTSGPTSTRASSRVSDTVSKRRRGRKNSKSGKSSRSSSRGSSRTSARGSSGSSRASSRASSGSSRCSSRTFGESSRASDLSSVRGSSRSSSRSSSRGSSRGSSRLSSRGSSRLSSRRSSNSARTTVTASTTDAHTQVKPQAPGGGIYVMRSGENMNTFPNWIEWAVDKYGEYEPYDQNQPLRIAKREGGMESYRLDPPLTHIGVLQAKLTARGLKHSVVQITTVYASPTMRSVQTAAHVHKNLSDSAKIRIRVEPGLFEWQGWYVECPRILSIGEMQEAGFPVDTDYQPILSFTKLLRQRNETVADAYQRIATTLNTIAGQESTRKGNILVVGHGLTQDAAATYRIATTTTMNMAKFTRGRLERFQGVYPPSSLIHLRPSPGTGWALHPSPVPTLTSLTFSNANAINAFHNPKPTSTSQLTQSLASGSNPAPSTKTAIPS